MSDRGSDYRVIETDVLVIGGGAAGARAAISARASGARTLVVTKSRFAKGGATPTANAADLTIDGKSAAEVGLPGDLRDSPETFFRDIVNDGLFLSNQKVVEAYVRENAPATRELLEWGMTVYSYEEAHSQAYVRGINTSGREVLKALGRGLRKAPPEWLEDHMIIDLLTRDGRICGALALDQRYGGLTVIHCKAAVVATGGWQSGWFLNSASTDLTGDGQAAVFRAGGELADMEMVQAMPSCLIWPPSLRNSYLSYVLISSGLGQLRNSLGERFMLKYDPRLAEASTKEIVSVGTELEILAGRGSPHGGVHFTLEGTSEEDFQAGLEAIAIYAPGSAQFREGFPKFAREAFGGRVYEVGNLMHYMLGGIRINEEGEGSLPGLFAAGECSSGLWGASRVSSAISEAVIQGRIAGRSAARYASSAVRLPLDDGQVKSLVDRVRAPLRRHRGVAPFELKRLVQGLAGRYLGVVKDKPGLERAAEDLTEIEEKVVPTLAVSGTRSPRVNAEWVEALQVTDLILVLKLAAISALRRTESRGAHYRLDHLQTDNDRWVRNIIVSQVDDKLRLTEEPVVTTSITPPRGRMTFEQALRVATASLSSKE